MRRTAIGVLVDPLLPSLVFVCDAGVTLAFALSYIYSFVFGIPAILLLKKVKKESHLVYSITGFLLGAAYVLVAGGLSIDSDVLTAAAIFGTVGFGTALTFTLMQGKEEKRYA